MIFALLLVLLCVGVGGFIFDLTPGARINFRNIEKITLGMRRPEVEAILGPPGDYFVNAPASAGPGNGVMKEEDFGNCYSKVWNSDTAAVAVCFTKNTAMGTAHQYADVCATIFKYRPRAQIHWWFWVIAEFQIPEIVRKNGTARFFVNESTAGNEDLRVTVKDLHWVKMPLVGKRLRLTFLVAWNPKSMPSYTLPAESKAWCMFSGNVGGGDPIHGCVEVDLHLGKRFVEQKVQTFEQTTAIAVPEKARFMSVLFFSREGPPAEPFVVTFHIMLPPR